jgi:putative transposase
MGGFDAVFEAENIRIVRTPIQVPEANGIAERFVRTARTECLDWLLILSARHLERALTVFIDHYDGWRPHRSLDLAPPNGPTSTATWTETPPITLKRRDRLGDSCTSTSARREQSNKRTVHPTSPSYDR